MGATAKRLAKIREEASLDLVLSTGEYYGLTVADMRQMVAEMVKTVSGWRGLARKLNIPRGEVDRLASAFEHRAHDEACAFLAR